MFPDTMKTIEMRDSGDADVLEIGQRPLPTFNDSQVLIKVSSAGVNGPDLVQRRGHYPAPKGASDLLGLEVSGTIVAVGSQVTGWQLDDSVCALTNGGGYAEYVAVNAGHCLPIPKSVDLLDAAGLPETYFTVWSNCFFQQNHTPDSLFLVHGGAGGIGSTAIQLGAALGLRVFTTCANAEDAAYCVELGAERAILYPEEDYVDIVREAGAANLILDTIGGDYIARNIKAASPDARIVQLAFNKGSKVEINLMPIMLKRIVYTGSTLRTRPDKFKNEIASSLHKTVWPLFQQQRLASRTHVMLPFEQAADAHKLMESATHRGKILLRPDS